MRIRKDKFYELETVPGISGREEWGKVDRRVCTGEHAQRNRLDVARVHVPLAGRLYRLENGKLPEYQPLVDCADAVSFMQAHSSATCFLGTYDATR